MLRLRVALAVLVLSTSAARAQEPEYKDGGTATLLSLGGTAASVGLMAASVALIDEGEDSEFGAGVFLAGLYSTAITPSFGHWYAHDYVTPGLVMRSAGLAMVTGAWFIVDDCLEDGCKRSGDWAAPLVVGGGAALVAGTIYDVVSARGSAREYNEKHPITMTPMIVKTSSGTATGLGLSGTF